MHCRTWTLVTAAAGFSVRSFFSLDTIQSGLIAFGGYAGAGSFYNDLWLSEDSGITWREITSSNMTPAKRAAGRLIPLNSADSCLLIGGWQRGPLPQKGGPPRYGPQPSDAAVAPVYLGEVYAVPEE